MSIHRLLYAYMYTMNIAYSYKVCMEYKISAHTKRPKQSKFLSHGGRFDSFCVTSPTPLSYNVCASSFSTQNVTLTLPIWKDEKCFYNKFLYMMCSLLFPMQCSLCCLVLTVFLSQPHSKFTPFKISVHVCNYHYDTLCILVHFASRVSCPSITRLYQSSLKTGFLE